MIRWVDIQTWCDVYRLDDEQAYNLHECLAELDSHYVLKARDKIASLRKEKEAKDANAGKR